MNVCLVSSRDLPHSADGEEFLQQAFVELGHKAEVRPWDDVSPKDKIDLCVLRTLWDYTKRLEDFTSWLESMKSASFPVVNSVELVEWGLNKSYLKDLENSGVNLPRTYIWEGEYLPNFIVLEEELGKPPYVFKPLISSGARDTFLVQGDVSYSAAIDRMKKMPFIAQSYIKEVKEGEISAMVFNGRFSHAVKKLPRPGDFRVQAEYGGQVRPAELSKELIEWSESVVTKAPSLPVIARVDFVLSQEKPLLMELEVFEPELFFSFRPESAKELAKMMLKSSS